MTRLFKYGITAFFLAAALTSAQQRQGAIGNAGIPTIDTIRQITDRMIFQRLLVPRDRWPPLPNPRMTASNPDIATLVAAATAQDPSLRWEYIHAVGRLGVAADLPLFVYPALADASVEVRAEAANAIALILHDIKQPEVKAAAAMAVPVLQDRIRRETDGQTAGTMLDVLGEIADEATARIVEPFLVSETRVLVPALPGAPDRRAGAMDGLEALTRHWPGRTYDAATRIQLRRLSIPGFGFAGETGPYLRAVQALVHIREDDVPTIRAIATFHCRSSRPECGWEVRRLGLQLMSGPKTQFLDALNQATRDQSFLVRIEAYRVFARDIPTSKTCSRLFGAWSDPEPWVVLEVIKLLDTRCESEKAVIAEQLKQWADDLGDENKDEHWQRPTAAFETLAKFDADGAKKIAHEMAAAHHVWFVRAAAARVAALIVDEQLAVDLTSDDEPNVRAEAINTLFRLKSGKLGAAAIAALDSSNYQLVYTAAVSLATSDDRASAGKPVLESLGRLTQIGDDTSREARLALLARVQQAGSADDDVQNLLTKLLRDPDPPVARAASDVLESLTGIHMPPAPFFIEHRKELLRYPCVDVVMSTGEHFGILVDPSLSPYNAEHFLSLVAVGFFNGLSFHRVIPDAFLESGSPAANYFTGADDRHLGDVGPERFLRDEITYARDPSLRHVRGIVAMSRHDPHTVATQFFIELVDSPHLNREFTIIGRVTYCQGSRIDDPMDTVDRLMQGARIASTRLVPVRPPLP